MKLHDAKWVHLEIYSQRFFFFPTQGLPTLTCSSVGAFEMQKVLKTRLPKHSQTKIKTHCHAPLLNSEHSLYYI